MALFVQYFIKENTVSFCLFYLCEGYVFTRVCHSVHRVGGGHAWQRGACMTRGACMAGGMCGRGHVWQGGLHGRGHVW